MTISLLLSDITDAIRDISIDGVTVRDADEISASWQSAPGILYPNPEGFITNFSLAYPTLMRGAAADVDITYSLNYRYLHVEIGDLSQMPRDYGQMIAKVSDIIEAMISTPAPYSGKVEMQVTGVTVGAREDPAGNMYHGADITLSITEMQNA